MPVEWLKAKYRIHKSAKKTKSGYDGNHKPAKPQRPLTDAEKALHSKQPYKVMRLYPNGRRRMFVTERSAK